MGLRKYERAIAKDRLLEMGVDRVNRKIGYSMKNSFNRKLHRTNKGKKKFARLTENLPLWKRVLWGDLAKEARAKQMRNGLVRYLNA